MTVREYIGARYVPLFMGEWDSTVAYEPLSIVQYQGNSYTSRQAVPAGIPITNETFWAVTGNYNAQIEAYRAEVRTFDGRITANANAIEAEAEAREEADTEIDAKLANVLASLINIDDLMFKGRFQWSRGLELRAVNPQTALSFRYQGMDYVIGSAQLDNGNTCSVKKAFKNISGSRFNWTVNNSTKNWGHAQSMCWDGTYIYVVPMSDYSQSPTTKLRSIYVVDPSTLSTVRTITVQNNVYTVSYDFKTGKYYYVSNGESADYESSGILYGFNLYEFSPTDGKETLVSDAIPWKEFTPAWINDAKVYNGVLYILGGPYSKVGAVDFNENKLLKVWVMPKEMNGYELDEPESISFDENGEATIAFRSHYGDSMYRHLVILSCNRSTMDVEYWTSPGTAQNSPMTVYVSPHTASDTTFYANGSQDYPYSDLNEAIMAACYNWQIAVIRPLAGVHYIHEFIASTPRVIDIYGMGRANTTLKGVMDIRLVPKLVIRAMKLVTASQYPNTNMISVSQGGDIWASEFSVDETESTNLNVYLFRVVAGIMGIGAIFDAGNSTFKLNKQFRIEKGSLLFSNSTVDLTDYTSFDATTRIYGIPIN